VQTFSTALPILLTLALSYFLALSASRKRTSVHATSYLFGGNSPALAVSSGVGSIFSFSIAATALVSGGYLYGWQVIPPLALGASLGTILLYRIYGSSAAAAFKTATKADSLRGGASYLRMVAPVFGRRVAQPLALLLLVSHFLMLTLELSLVKLVLVSTTSFTPMDLVVILITVVGICYAYVYVGGYRGVLLTDHFQLWTIILLLGVCIGQSDAVNTLFMPEPLPTRGAIHWPSFLNIVLLHASVVSGGFLFSAGSLDQWYRTAGTLPLPQAKRVLRISLALYSLGGIPLVLVGNAAHRWGLTAEGPLNQISLTLLQRGLTLAPPSLQFALLVVLTCILLTTIDTHIITLQQLYYETALGTSDQSGARKVLRRFLGPQQIRVFAALAVTLSTTIVLLAGEKLVFRAGLAVLSAPGFLAPILFLVGFPESRLARALDSPRALGAAFLLSVALFPPLLSLFVRLQGPLDEHLYLICGAALFAQVAGYGITALVRCAQQKRSR